MLCLVVSHQDILGVCILHSPFLSATHCSPSTVIALLSFITASVDVTAQSVDCPFMSRAPKRRFESVCPHYHFMCAHTCGQFPPPNASKGILKRKQSYHAEENCHGSSKTMVNKSVCALKNEKGHCSVSARQWGL